MTPKRRNGDFQIAVGGPEPVGLLKTNMAIESMKWFTSGPFAPFREFRGQ